MNYGDSSDIWGDKLKLLYNGIQNIYQATYILFLTELHRRTDFTKAHRDIKSTDDTEPFS
ncbi:hypothetical protein AXF23_13600 [Prevotella sp. oral taxon 313]|nr:hypothetical protein AXF23_13600 [Prevotella sp. oral taxon 313]